MNNEQQSFLEKSLDTVTSWLQFAEAKHAALIAFLVALLAILFSDFFTGHPIFKLIIGISLFLALCVSMSTFYPRTTKDASQPLEDYSANDTLLFWKDISKYSAEDYLKKLYKDFFDEEKTTFSTSEKLYAHQIISLARIARVKYDLFAKALKIVFISIALIIVLLIVVA